jgi:O-antigen/teichoic acid export membrane protein
VVSTTFANLLLTQTDKVLLSHLLSLREFSYYTLAATVAGIAYMAASPVVQAIYPRVVEHSVRGDWDELVSTYHHGAQIVTVLTAPATLLLTVFSGNGVFMWSGSAELARGTAPILSALALATFLNVALSMPYYLQLAHGWTRAAFICTVIAIVVFVPAIIVVVPRYGAVGAAWISVVLYLSYVLIAAQYTHHRLLPSEKWHWYFQDILLPASAAGVVVFISHGFRPGNYTDRWHWLAFLIVAGALASIAAAMAAGKIRPRVNAYARGVLHLA